MPAHAGAGCSRQAEAGRLKQAGAAEAGAAGGPRLAGGGAAEAGEGLGRHAHERGFAEEVARLAHALLCHLQHLRTHSRSSRHRRSRSHRRSSCRRRSSHQRRSSRLAILSATELNCNRRTGSAALHLSTVCRASWHHSYGSDQIRSDQIRSEQVFEPRL